MFSWLSPSHKPIIVAHRGSSADAPENTIAAFRQAVTDGADAIELDVHLSKDKQIVVIHDDTLHRTTSGRGRVSQCSLAELKELSAGAWLNRRFATEGIPTLDEVFDILPGSMGINIEIKIDPNRRQQFELVERCCEMIEHFSAFHRALISSFSHSIVKRTRTIEPRSATGLLYHPVRHMGRSAAVLARTAQADYLILSGTSMRKTSVCNAHERGILVGEYTIDTRWRAERAIRFSVDAIYSNDPARASDFTTLK